VTCLAIVAVFFELHEEVRLRQTFLGGVIERGEGLPDGAVELGEEAGQKLVAGLLHLRVVVGDALLVHLGDDLVDGLEFSRPVEQRPKRPLSGEKAYSVLVGELLVELDQARMQALLVRLGDDQDDLVGCDIDLIDRWER
jgi:hypothetical protein